MILLFLLSVCRFIATLTVALGNNKLIKRYANTLPGDKIP